MEGFVDLTPRAWNTKTGPIPVSTSGMDTCPISCPLLNTCYASSGPLSWHWNNVTTGEKGVAYGEFLAKIRKLAKGTLWRHNQAGDLQGDRRFIDRDMLFDLVAANRGRRGFTYTHYPVLDETDREAAAHNAALVAHANENGFTINLSADNLDEADKMAALNIGPVVVVLPSDAPKVTRTESGRKVVLCPAQYNKEMTCERCQICQQADRSNIVGFAAHGTKAKAVDRIVREAT